MEPERTLTSSLLRFGLTVLAGFPVLVVLLALGAVRLAQAPPDVLDAIPPEPAIVLDSERGRVLLAHAEGTADLEALQRAFVEQQHGSFCAVASGVAAVNALTPDSTVDQLTWFTPEVEAVRGYWTTLFLGMTRDSLADQLDAHGLVATSTSAGEGLQAFRTEVARNLTTGGDVLLVNYDRRALDQLGSGHVSPVAAWDADTDRVLVLDTAAYKYPPHWVPVRDLFEAMDTIDPESGGRRGWVVASRP